MTLRQLELPQAIRSWQAEQPDRTVRLSELRDGLALVQAILDGAAELGIGPRPLDWPGDAVVLEREPWPLRPRGAAEVGAV